MLDLLMGGLDALCASATWSNGGEGPSELGCGGCAAKTSSSSCPKVCCPPSCPCYCPPTSVCSPFPCQWPPFGGRWMPSPANPCFPLPCCCPAPNYPPAICGPPPAPDHCYPYYHCH